MHFLITAFDGTDEGALERRLAARAAHLALGDSMIAAGTLLYAAAILDDNEKMIGSSMIVHFPTRSDLDAWLQQEPYALGGVWKDIQVRRCRPGPSFLPK